METIICHSWELFGCSQDELNILMPANANFKIVDFWILEKTSDVKK